MQVYMKLLEKIDAFDKLCQLFGILSYGRAVQPQQICGFPGDQLYLRKFGGKKLPDDFFILE